MIAFLIRQEKEKTTATSCLHTLPSCTHYRPLHRYFIPLLNQLCIITCVLQFVICQDEKKSVLAARCYRHVNPCKMTWLGLRRSNAACADSYSAAKALRTHIYSCFKLEDGLQSRCWTWSVPAHCGAAHIGSSPPKPWNMEEKNDEAVGTIRSMAASDEAVTQTRPIPVLEAMQPPLWGTALALVGHTALHLRASHFSFFINSST